MDDLNDLDRLVQRAVDGITTIAGRAAAFSTRLLLGTMVVCVGGFLLGTAALSGGIRTVWIVLGVTFGAIAIGGAFVARWRVGSVRRHVPELADEIRTLISEGADGSRTVIETFTIDEDGDGRRDGLDGGSAVIMSRQMYGFRNMAGSGLESSARLTAALTALTSFPLLVLSAVLVSLVFAFLGAIFLIALAL